MSLFFSPPLLNNQDQAQPNKNCTPGKYYFLFFLQDNSPLVFALHAVFSAPRWRNSSLLFDFLFLLDGVEPHSKNIILTAFSSSFVKYFPMWTKTKKKKSGGGGKKSRRGKRVAETQSWSCFQLQLFFSLPKFSGVFFFFHRRAKKKCNRTREVPQLGRECDRRGLPVSQGLLQYVYSSGPSSPMEAFRTGGERSRRCVHKPRKVSGSVASLWTFQQGGVRRDRCERWWDDLQSSESKKIIIIFK